MAESSLHTSDDSALARPYSPSWLDRLNELLARLPFPAWLFHTVLALIGIVGFASVQWATGQYPVGTFYPWHVYQIGTSFYGLTMVYYLDRYAHHALDRFRPVLDATSKVENLLRYRLTTLPARPTWIATIIGFGLGALAFLVPLEVRTITYNYSPGALSDTLYIAAYILLWITGSVVVYHTIHQLRVVNFILTRHTKINLFHHRPLYALSWLTAYTAIGAVISMITGILIVPGAGDASGAAQVISFGITLAISLTIPLVAFIWPLWGIHRLLVAEKDRLLDNNTTALEHTIQEVRQYVATSEFERVNSITKVMEALETEARLIKAISTWPWQPGTLNGVIAAVLFPVVISLIQKFLLQLVP